MQITADQARMLAEELSPSATIWGKTGGNLEACAMTLVGRELAAVEVALLCYDIDQWFTTQCWSGTTIFEVHDEEAGWAVELKMGCNTTESDCYSDPLSPRLEAMERIVAERKEKG